MRFVNRTPLSFLAASRIQLVPLTRLSKLCVLACGSSSGFPDVSGLPSPVPRPAGLRWVIGTTPSSDFPEACMAVIRVCPSTARPGRRLCLALPGSPGSRAQRFSTCVGSSTPPVRYASRGDDASHVPFPLQVQGRRPEDSFGAQYPRPSMPLSTLRSPPRDGGRMTRGRCGSLLLQRTALSSAPLSRFIPALTCP